MAYTIEQKPNQLAGANNPMIFVLKESTSIINDAKFKYVAKIYKSTTNASTWTLLTTIKVHKNNAGVGIIDIHKIVRSSLETQETNVGNIAADTIDGSIHSIGISDTSNSYSQNTSQVVGIKVEGGYEKATSQTAAPVLTLPSGGVDGASEIIYSIPATTPFTKTASNVGGLDIDGTNNPLTNYIPSGATKKFLTNAPRVQFVRGSSTAADNIDELTIAFINDGLITDGDVLVKMAIEYYNSSGGQIGSTKYFTNDVASGGKATADDVKNSLLYFGCGTANLQNQVDVNDAQPSDFTDWAYYVIYGADGSGNQETDKYYFYRYGSGATVDDRHQSCTRYDNIRLAWRNRLGAWDYMNFRGKSTESVDIKKEEMEKVVGSWNSATFDYENYDRGRETLFTEAKRKLVVNSDWLNEDEGAWLEELFTSTNVHLLADNSIVYPMIITNTTYTKKTSVNDKIKIQYTINLEYANKVKTNS
mgnify:FL=1|jgi:hypothetical protein|tara:strand:+ start:847 stop:2274 length:1428 start_codon:yes stop_codon:yes gene_type:complete